jgi:hypothetical protein
MGIYKQTYYIGFSKELPREPESFCNKIAELFYCNIDYSLDTDDKNYKLPQKKYYDFGKKITLNVGHSYYLDDDIFEDDDSNYINKYPSISYDIDFTPIFNKRLELRFSQTGLISIYIDEILWRWFSLSINDEFTDDMKKLLMQNRPSVINILRAFGCSEALILPDCLDDYLDSIMDTAFEADKPILSFEEMKQRLFEEENMYYYDVEKLLNGKFELNKSEQKGATGYYDNFNPIY